MRYLVSVLMTVFSLAELARVSPDSDSAQALERLHSARDIISLVDQRHLSTLPPLAQEVPDSEPGSEVQLLAKRMSHTMP